MTATAHALVGGAISVTLKDPAIGLTLSAISHPFLDMVPHWDFGWGWREKTKPRLFFQAASDLLVGFAAAYLFFGRFTDFWYFFACVFASLFWDILESPYWFFNWRFAPFSWIYNIQSKMQGRLGLPWGIITQVLSVILLIAVLQGLK